MTKFWFGKSTTLDEGDRRCERIMDMDPDLPDPRRRQRQSGNYRESTPDTSAFAIMRNSSKLRKKLGDEVPLKSACQSLTLAFAPR
jgi:hypothetical protein